MEGTSQEDWPSLMAHLVTRGTKGLHKEGRVLRTRKYHMFSQILYEESLLGNFPLAARLF